jgi:hypothetical protein
MNKDSIDAIVRCAFQICCIYFLKCFYPSVKFGSCVSLCTARNYDKELCEIIYKLKKILCDVEPLTHKKCDKPNEQSRKQETPCFTKTDEYYPANKNIAYGEIKDTITQQLKDKYGENICVDFTYDDCDDSKMLYSLKIKEIGKCDPDPRDFCESEIYVNTKNKTFHVKIGNKFKSFPLVKKSIVKCERIF